MEDTTGSAYTDRLTSRSGAKWKRLLNVQAPYQWNLRRQALGRTVDVGCGIGRNLANLPAGSVGVDHNQTSVAVARAAGLAAMTVDEWEASAFKDSASFDSLLLSHVIEHMSHDEALNLVNSYLPALRAAGRILLICPQEKGYSSDPTHQTFVTGEDLEALAREVGLSPGPWRSFPLPRRFGSHFTHNEFHVMATKR